MTRDHCCWRDVGKKNLCAMIMAVAEARCGDPNRIPISAWKDLGDSKPSIEANFRFMMRRIMLVKRSWSIAIAFTLSGRVAAV